MEDGMKVNLEQIYNRIKWNGWMEWMDGWKMLSRCKCTMKGRWAVVAVVEVIRPVIVHGFVIPLRSPVPLVGTRETIHDLRSKLLSV